MHSAAYWIKKLNLQQHPEGGWFKEIYRSGDVIPSEALPENFSGERNCSTSIYYLLEKENVSSFHRIKSDEVWHYYAGSSAIEILYLHNGALLSQKLGSDFDAGEQFQFVVPKNTWFAARLTDSNGYALVGCTVSPGFNFDDFELADDSLAQDFPYFAEEIKKLIL
ncbi:cupin domain-containing protein [Draconibacterium sp. IB214405]|uniref:cupin domain-containing protein n=1 Tax=Draconibacterium sp. IB214405 TaxID=3097352 RepID=UPI002A15A21B|nr:cupin domain-containing protein [Draconibacterium sp. IB214405]MDX8339670.1 cupin domain-containing protein [Draconibacterium sp. IB214405]